MARRTRACATCWKRRIKCDEKFPRCEECTRNDRVCPGPLQGPMMVDMTQKVARQAGSVHKSRVKTTCRSPRDEKSICMFPLPQSPSVQHVMSQLFVARFLSFFCGGQRAGLKRTPWIMRLPLISSNLSGPSTVIVSLRAAAMAHYAAEAGQKDAMIQSSEVYTQALSLYSTFIGETLRGRCSDPAVLFKIVSSNLILAYFEAIQCTSLEAYGLHINAAARVLEMAEPARCGTGPLNQLFFAVRSQMVSVLLKRRREIFNVFRSL